MCGDSERNTSVTTAKYFHLCPSFFINSKNFKELFFVYWNISGLVSASTN